MFTEFDIALLWALKLCIVLVLAWVACGFLLGAYDSWRNREEETIRRNPETGLLDVEYYKRKSWPCISFRRKK